MSNLSTGNFQFNNQSVNSSYQAVIIILHWLDCEWEKQEWAKLIILLINSFLFSYNIRFICPQASAITVDLNIPEHIGPKIEPAWYNIISLEDLENGESGHGLLESIEWIEKIIEREIKKGVPSQNIFIAGFSQGGSLSLAVAMISQYELGGFVSLAGFIPYPKILRKIETGKNKKTPIFMVHGQRDTFVPYEKAQKSFQILKQSGYRVDPIKVYPDLGHKPSHFFPMVANGLVFLEKIFQTRNLPRLNFLNPENIEVIRREKK